MQTIIKGVFLGLLFLAGTAITGQAQQTPISTAVPFLRLPSDAASSGMANIGVATMPTASSALWNPAKVSFNKQQGAIAINYTPWLKELANDMFLASLAGYHKLDDNQSVHGSFRYFNMGDLQFTDDNGTHLQHFQAREWTVDAGYSRKLSAKSGIGLTIRYIHSNLSANGVGGNDYQAGNAVAADIGYYYQGLNAAGTGWSFGGALTNLGTKMNYSKTSNEKNFLPANINIGTAYTKAIGEQHVITIGLDLNKLLVPSLAVNADPATINAYQNKSVTSSWFNSFNSGFNNELKKVQIGAGAEYWYNQQFAIRGGYSWEDKSQGNRKYFTAGAGVKYEFATFNFSWLIAAGNGINQHPLNNTLSFGVVFSSK